MSKGSWQRPGDKARYARNFDSIRWAPGSKAAKDAGCKCHAPEGDGCTGYIDPMCPLHGGPRQIQTLHKHRKD